MRRYFWQKKLRLPQMRKIGRFFWEKKLAVVGFEPES